jgi:nitrogen fixation NifU-like protein
MVSTMYKQEILEIYSEKPNYGSLNKKTHEINLENPSCKDKIKIELEIEDKKVKDARFSGKTCFITTVSASKLLEKVKGMKVKKIKELTKKDMDKFLGIDVIPTRINCEMLPLKALKKIKC